MRRGVKRTIGLLCASLIITASGDAEPEDDPVRGSPFELTFPEAGAVAFVTPPPEGGYVRTRMID